MSFKMRIRYAEHEGDTKFFRVVELYDLSKNQMLLLFNYGKIRAVGQIVLAPVGGQDNADKKVREKEKRGYYFRGPGSIDTHYVEGDAERVKDMLPRHIYTHPAVVEFLAQEVTVEESINVVASSMDTKREIDRSMVADWGTW